MFQHAIPYLVNGPLNKIVMLAHKQPKYQSGKSVIAATTGVANATNATKNSINAIKNIIFSGVKHEINSTINLPTQYYITIVRATKTTRVI